MREFFESIMPNVIPKLPALWNATLETLAMTGISALYILVIGMALGILLTVTKKGGLLENAVVYRVLDIIINLLRSVPFIILLFLLIPLTRIISGTSIGVAGSIFPLIVGTVPFFSRQAEAALAGVSPGLIEAAQSMGASIPTIIFKVLQARDHFQSVHPREHSGSFPRYHDHPDKPRRTHRDGWRSRRGRPRKLRVRSGRSAQLLRHYRCRSYRAGAHRPGYPDNRQHHRKENREINR